jgi:hypothetical protein
VDSQRRIFLAGIGGLALGLAADTETGVSAKEEIPGLPWPYEKLDVEKTRKLAHQRDYTTNCSSGAFGAIISQLQEKVGYPWTVIPLDLYAYGGGGVNGWGTFCGALNGACGAITLVAGKKAQGQLVNELIGWYTEYPFPSVESNTYAREHSFLVETYHFDRELSRSTPGSPLCHVSIARWCAASGFGGGSPERAERCARLCGDVAARAVELLNNHKDGSFTAAYAPRTETTGCTSCHASGKDAVKKQVAVGKQNCLDCHEKHK